MRSRSRCSAPPTTTTEDLRGGPGGHRLLAPAGEAHHARRPGAAPAPRHRGGPRAARQRQIKATGRVPRRAGRDLDPERRAGSGAPLTATAPGPAVAGVAGFPSGGYTSRVAEPSSSPSRRSFLQALGAVRSPPARRLAPPAVAPGGARGPGRRAARANHAARRQGGRPAPVAGPERPRVVVVKDQEGAHLGLRRRPRPLRAMLARA